MERLDTEHLKGALICACTNIIKNERLLTELDTMIGDGDHGVTMKSGFTALKEYLETEKAVSVSELFREAGILLVRVMGGASGVIFGTMFLGDQNALKNPDAVNAEELTMFFRGSCASISRRGKSSTGDKTMLDALCPAVEAMALALKESNDLNIILLAAKNAAARGVDNTKNMVPRKGRAKNFREAGVGLPDPGAVSVSIIFSSIYEYVQSLDCR